MYVRYKPLEAKSNVLSRENRRHYGALREKNGLKYVFILKKKIHCSCEIEYFVESHLCKLCVVLRSRVLWVVCLH